jgi:hypothetical protein
MPFDSPACQAFVVRFLICAVIQGFIMFVQNSYQRRRTYTRIALGALPSHGPRFIYRAK